MRFHVVIDVGTMPRIQVAEARLREGHVVVRHYYRSGIAAKRALAWLRIPRDTSAPAASGTR